MLNIEAKLEVVGKPEPRDWKNNEGQTMKSYRLNVAQNDGVDIARRMFMQAFTAAM